MLLPDFLTKWLKESLERAQATMDSEITKEQISEQVQRMRGYDENLRVVLEYAAEIIIRERREKIFWRQLAMLPKNVEQ